MYNEKNTVTHTNKKRKKEEKKKQKINEEIQ